MVVNKDEREDEEAEESESDSDATAERENQCPSMGFTEAIELSLNSVMGLMMQGTMKIRGRVGTKEVTVLIGCGATHNFVSLELVEELKLPLISTSNYGVVMGTGVAVGGKGIFKGIIVEMQGLTVLEDFLPLKLGSTDVILGM